MRKVICLCGQQVRTTPEMAGMTISCARCGRNLQVPAKVDDRLSAPGLHTEHLQDHPVLHHRRDARQTAGELLRENAFDDDNFDSEGLTVGKVIAGAILSLATIAVVAGIVLYLPALRAPGGLLAPKYDPKQFVKVEEEKPKEYWANHVAWVNDFSQVPSGNKIGELSKKIVAKGSEYDSQGFWTLLDEHVFDDRVVGPEGSRLAVKDQISVASILDHLKSQPIDSISIPELSGLAAWDIIGVHNKRTTVGVLVRYFNDPWSPKSVFEDPTTRDALQRICTFEELSSVTENFLDTRVVKEVKRTDAQAPSDEEASTSTAKTYYGITTPTFGYLVLLFDFTDGAVKWIDVLPLPGEVPYSRASGTLVQKDWVIFRRRVGMLNQKNTEVVQTNDEAWIDAFGEYDSADSYPFADTLIFSKNPIDQETAEALSASTYTVKQDRSKQLIKIAQALRTDPSAYHQLANNFRQRYPGDIAADALAVSMWFQHWNNRPTDDRKRILAKQMFDTIQRLRESTSDTFLLDLEYRIHDSIGNNDELTAMESELDALDLNSTAILKSRLRRACENKDKQQILQALQDINATWLAQPKVTKSDSTNEQWETLRKSWAPVSPSANQNAF